MDRRTLLTRLASGIVGVSLVHTEWIPAAMTSELPPTASPTTDMRWQVADFLAEMVNGPLHGWDGRFIPGHYTIGSGGMTDQFNISYEPGFGLSREELLARCIHPAAIALSRKVHHNNLYAFGALPIPVLPGVDRIEGAVATDKVTGVTIRGLRVFIPYDPVQNVPEHWVDQFDVLGRRRAV